MMEAWVFLLTNVILSHVNFTLVRVNLRMSIFDISVRREQNVFGKERYS